MEFPQVYPDFPALSLVFKAALLVLAARQTFLVRINRHEALPTRGPGCVVRACSGARLRNEPGPAGPVLPAVHGPDRRPVALDAGAAHLGAGPGVRAGVV